MGILNVATYVTVNGQYVNVLEMNQYQNKIRFLQLTGTSGTLTSEQINLLRSDNTNYIIVDNELYNCNDLQDSNGYLVYTHTGADASGNVNIKTLSITLTNNSWSIQTTPVQPKIPVANTNEAVQFAEDERQKSKNLFDYTKIKSLNYGIAQADNVFTINTQFYYPSIDYDINLNQGETYTFSLNIDSYSNSDGSGVNSEIVLYSANGDTDTKGVGGVNSTGRYSMTFTPTFDVVKVQIRPIRKNNNTSTLTGTVSNLMLCVGEDSDYQPYNGPIVHEKRLVEKSMTLIYKIYVPDETYSQLRFDNLPGIYNYKLIVIGAVDTAYDGSIKINDTDLKSITLRTNSSGTTVDNLLGDTALIRVDNRFRIDAEISVTDTYIGTPIAMEINNISNSTENILYGRKTSSIMLGDGGVGIKSITVDIGTSKFYRGTQAYLYRLGDTK